MEDGELTERASYIADLERRVACLERMAEISHLLNATLDLPKLLQYIIETATEVVEAETASILLFDERTNELFFAAATGESQETMSQIKVPLEGSLAGTIFQTGDPVIVGDVSGDARHYAGVDQSISFQTQSLLGVPMEVRNRRIGVLEALNKVAGGQFDAEDVKNLSTMAAHATVAIENARLVARLQAANRRLAELDRHKTNFISIASHELRTPLMIVQGYAGFLRHHATEETSADVDMVLRGARKLQTIIDQMTNLNYLESGKLELDPDRVVLQDVISVVCIDWRPIMATKQQTFSVEMPDQPIQVQVDRNKIALVLNNLLDNASRFTPEGGSISVSLTPYTGKIAVVVSDTGVGIPKDELNNIFDRFYQVEDHLTRHHGGMGLGLSIARAVVEQHGGHIWAESAEGQGSRFIFTLPMVMSQRAGK